MNGSTEAGSATGSRVAAENPPSVEDRTLTESPAPVRSAVCTAFALGWHVSQLFEDASLDRRRCTNGRRELPSFDALSPFERTQFAVQEVSADLHKLRGFFLAAGIAPISMEPLAEALRAAHMDLSRLRRMIEAKHVEVMPALLAADFRLGKAYVLGRGLANTSLRPEDKKSFEDAFGPPIVGIKSSLADLASALPEHSSRAVVLSLRTWEAWASAPELDGKDLDWATQWPGVRSALRRQGELWRALLSGEKESHDMLEPHDYLRAARGLVRQTTRILRSVGIPLIFCAVLLVGLLGGGIALLVLSSDGGKIVGAFTAAAGVLGITGAGIRARMSGAAQQLESGLWGAEMDMAVAEAVTVGPEQWGEQVRKFQVPATGEPPKAARNIDVLKQFRVAVAKGRKRKMRKLLALEADFKTLDVATNGRDEVANWLVTAPERIEIASKPDRVVEGRPGCLVAQVAGASHLWRLREGQIRVWERFADRDGARRAAGLPPQR